MASNEGFAFNEDQLDILAEAWDKELQSRLRNQQQTRGTSNTSSSYSPRTTLGIKPSQVIGDAQDILDSFDLSPEHSFPNDLELLDPLGRYTIEGSTSGTSPESVAEASPIAYYTMPAEQRQQSTSSASLREVRARPRQLQRIFTDPAQPRRTRELRSSIAPSATVNTLDSPLANFKRARAQQSDKLSACWTSPLCPNNKKEGSPPDPATCNAGCAPFLFGDNAPEGPPTTISNQALLTLHPLSRSDVDPPEKQQAPQHKRGQIQSKDPQNGRTFESTTPEDQADSPEDIAESVELKDSKPSTASRRRQPHNQVERKYRESLNSQLEALRKVIPSLSRSTQSGLAECQNGADIEDLPATTNSKPSKAVILASATAHIKQVEKERKRLEDENELLKRRVKALQGLLKCEDCSLMQYVQGMRIGNGQ